MLATHVGCARATARASAENCTLDSAAKDVGAEASRPKASRSIARRAASSASLGSAGFGGAAAAGGARGGGRATTTGARGAAAGGRPGKASAAGSGAAASAHPPPPPPPTRLANWPGTISRSITVRLPSRCTASGCSRCRPGAAALGVSRPAKRAAKIELASVRRRATRPPGSGEVSFRCSHASATCAAP